MKELKIENQIRFAINKVEEQGWSVVSLNIPENYQGIIVNDMVRATDRPANSGLKLQNLFGYPVYGGHFGLTIKFDKD